MKFLVLAAMDCEIRPLEEAGIRTIKTGIGKVNAARCATESILSEKPDAVISTGCAGGMAKGLKLNDLVIARETAYHDVWCGDVMGRVQGEPQRFPSDQELLKTAREIAPSSKVGLIVTGDQFYISQQEDQRILNLYPDALAADMESAAIAQVCSHYNIPFLSLRYISDLHDNDDDQRQQYEDFKQNFSSAELLIRLCNKLSEA